MTTQKKGKEGVIVALDQEKAYDKIKHDYPWKVLKKYNLPNNFINTVKTLYKSAETTVMINGVNSKPFRVERRVRQGDPLSCLLFNVAIEPLATALQNSKIKGFKIEGMEEKLVTLLFADDTTVFLSKEDGFDKLKEILDMWCRASGAKFNIKKTKVLLIGPETYRKRVGEKRRVHPEDVGNKIPESIK